ncbi:MAG: response regulator transcription factor [Thermoleophilia bacterium]
MRILVVEDVRRLAAYIKKGLEAQSYSVDCAYDGEEAEQRALAGDYDLLLLDLMLPKKDGLTVCRDLRKKGLSKPILMLTAKREVEDRIAGLDCGADDYLVKPFDFAELLARIRSLLRRPQERLSEPLEVKDITMDSSIRTVKRAGQVIKLSVKEYAVLDYLLRNKNMVLTRTQILNHCWDWNLETFSNVVDVYVRKLRRKLDPADRERYIKTVRGVGYKIED